MILVSVQHHRANSPNLLRSCTTPAIAIDRDANGTFRYAITGPSAGSYVVAIDATSARVQGSQVRLQPSGALAVSLHLGLPGCGLSGDLPKLTTGPHTVTLFRDDQLVGSASARA